MVKFRPEKYLQDTVKHIESIIYSSNLDGTEYFFITDAVTRLFGYKPSEIVSERKAFLKKVHLKDFNNFKNFVKTLKAGKPAVVEYQVLDKWGNYRYVRNNGFPVFEDGKLVRIDGVIAEITKEKNFQLELERSEKKYRLLIETANELIFDLDTYGYFKTINNYGAMALGFKSEDITGRHFLEFINDRNKAELAIVFQEILRSDNIISFEAVFNDRFGTDVIFDIQARVLRTGGELTGVLGVGRNITLRKKDEEKLKELNNKLIEANRIISIERDRAKQQISVLEEVNKLKSEFISNISHELRTPLASIIGFSETINIDPDMPKDMVSEFNNIILSEGKRLARLINDLLDFANMEGGKLQVLKSDFDVIELLQNTVNNFQAEAAEKGIILTADIPDTVVYLYADKDRITQVFNHLIHNALKFTNKGGRVKIIAQNFLKEFEIIVSDTGIGIPEKDLAHIFQKFFKTETTLLQFPGAGIGLGLVKQIVDLHKGLISVQSEVGKGTTFVVKFPKKLDINR